MLQKLQKTVDELSASSAIQREELAGWKNTCERLTRALNRKEKEIQSLADKCGDLEEVVRLVYIIKQIRYWRIGVDVCKILRFIYH